jgi:hypothetical protein
MADKELASCAIVIFLPAIPLASKMMRPQKGVGA